MTLPVTPVRLPRPKIAPRAPQQPSKPSRLDKTLDAIKDFSTMVVGQSAVDLAKDVRQAGLGAAESAINFARLPITKGMPGSQVSLRAAPPQNKTEAVIRSLFGAFSPTFGEPLSSYPGFVGAKGIEPFRAGEAALATTAILNTAKRAAADVLAGPLRQPGAALRVLGAPSAQVRGAAGVAKEPSISVVRADLKRELMRRMEAGEPLPVGLQGKKTAKGITDLIDEMPDRIVQDWLSTIFPDVGATAAGAAKQPWQMTQKEFGDTLNEAIKSIKGAKAREAATLKAAEDLTGIKAAPRDLGHKKAVEQALSEGKPVPAEVLAEYPDLAKQAAARPPVAQAPMPAAAKATAEPTISLPRAEPQPATAGGGAAPPKAPPPSPPTGPPVVPSPEEPLAANIRLSKYPEDIRGPIKAWADAHPDLVQAARRGVRSDAQVLADARALTVEVGGDFAKIQKRWKSGEAWNPEEILAIRSVLRRQSGDVLAAAQAVRTENSAQNGAALLLTIQQQARTQEILHGVTAEAGRSLRTFRQDVFESLGQGDAAKLETILAKYMDRSKIEETALLIAKLNVNDPVAINNFIRSVVKPKLIDYFIEIFYNSILSGPKTHIINALSNTATTLGAAPERLAAAGVEQILAPISRRPIQRFWQEAPADMIGAVQGLDEGVRTALTTLKTGIRPSDVTKYEFTPHAFRGNLGRAINAPSTALEAADGFGYSVNYRAAIGATIQRTARSEGLTGKALVDRIVELTANPTEAMIKEAADTAEYRLFRKKAGPFLSEVMRFRNKYPALRFIVPFLRTPMNLFTFGIERSPVGLLNPSMYRNIATKNPVAADQIARVFLGSAIAGLVGWYFANGRITGQAPTDLAERDRFYREGKQPYSVNIGGYWVQYRRLEPYNQMLSEAAIVVDAINDKDSTVDEKAAQAAFSIGENLVSQTYLSGLSDFLDAVAEPERNGSKYLGRFLTAFIPASAANRTLAQMFDSTIRRPENILQTVETSIPGLSQRVPPALTAFGEEAQRNTPPWSPISVSKAELDAVDSELSELGVDVGFVGNTILGVTLPPEQKRKYQALAGELSYSALSDLFASREYIDAVQSDKIKMVSKTIERVRDQARDQVKPAINLKDVDPIIKDRVKADQLLLSSFYWEPWRSPKSSVSEKEKLDYEAWQRATASKSVPDRPLDLMEMKELEKRFTKLRLEGRKRVPDIDRAVVQFYGETPQSQTVKLEVAQGKIPGVSPLAALDDMGPDTEQALRLAGITTLQGLRSADFSAIMRATGAKERRIDAWRQEARRLLDLAPVAP